MEGTFAGRGVDEDFAMRLTEAVSVKSRRASRARRGEDLGKVPSREGGKFFFQACENGVGI